MSSEIFASPVAALTVMVGFTYRMATSVTDLTVVIPIEKPGPILLAVDHRVIPSATPEIAAADLFNATRFVVAGI
jgi:hypothetical protein